MQSFKNTNNLNVDNYLHEALRKNGYIDLLLNEISNLQQEEKDEGDEIMKYWWLGFLFLKFYPQFQFQGNPEWCNLFPVTLGWFITEIYKTSLA